MKSEFFIFSLVELETCYCTRDCFIKRHTTHERWMQGLKFFLFTFPFRIMTSKIIKISQSRFLARPGATSSPVESLKLCRDCIGVVVDLQQVFVSLSNRQGRFSPTHFEWSTQRIRIIKISLSTSSHKQKKKKKKFEGEWHLEVKRAKPPLPPP